MAFPVTPARKLLPGDAAMERTVAGNTLGFDLDGAGCFFSDLWQLIKVKAAELAAFFTSLLSALAKKADELFPPETRPERLRQWLHVAATVVLPAALGALASLCLARCCWRCCCAGATSRRRSGAMMVAPGRGGARMLRGAFEDDPRLYFRDLRARKPLLY